MSNQTNPNPIDEETDLPNEGVDAPEQEQAGGKQSNKSKKSDKVNPNPIDDKIKNISPSILIMEIPEARKQNIYDTIVSYIQANVDRDTLLFSITKKIEEEIIKSVNSLS